jgi:hypothetical protein
MLFWGRVPPEDVDDPPPPQPTKAVNAISAEAKTENRRPWFRWLIDDPMRGE